MKLWVKLSLLIFVIANIIIEVTLFVIKPQMKETIIEQLGEKLKSIAATAVVYIDGNEFKKADLFDSTFTSSGDYNQLQNLLTKAKANLDMDGETYTLSLLDNNSAVFGVMANRIPFSGDTLQSISLTARDAALKVYETKQCIFTNIYEDSYGVWISGMAPIFDSTETVVGILQVDNNFDTVQAKLAELNDSIKWIQLFLIPFTIIISIVVSRFFTKPIQNIKNRIVKIAKGDYTENKIIKTGGELKELADSSEMLRNTILKQQEAILNKIDELKNAKEKAEASDRLKSEFLALISHEIRTPINIIQGNMNLIKEELRAYVDDDLSSCFDSVDKGNGRLIRTIELIILYSEIISKNYEKREAEINIEDTLKRILEKYKEEISIKDLKIIFNKTAAPIFIKGDPHTVEQIFEQLINNSIKFTNKGFVKIEIEEEKHTIKITDSGIGMSKEFFNSIFQPFIQEEQGYTRKYDGNGLGLPLVKKCCELNDFGIKIKSEKAVGTEVKICFEPHQFIKSRSVNPKKAATL